MRYIYIIVCFCLITCQNRVKQEDLSKNSKETTEKNNGTNKTYIEYYENGNKKVICTLDNGKYNGKYIKLYQNGKSEEIGIMVNGRKNGIWKNFTEKGILENVSQYYNDSLLFHLDKSDFILLPKLLEQDKVKISIPVNWQTKNVDDPCVLLVSQKKCSKSDIFCPNITITKEILKEGLSFNDYLLLSNKLLQKQLNSFKPVTKCQILIADFSAFQMTYLMQVNGVKLGGITTWINKEGSIYIITGIAINETNSEFLKYKGLFQEITETFKNY